MCGGSTYAIADLRRGVLDGFTPGLFGHLRRRCTPEYLFTQDAEDDEDDASPDDVLVIP
jgi:hypothetical protein